jgi:hypothetical protein
VSPVTFPDGSHRTTERSTPVDGGDPGRHGLTAWAARLLVDDAVRERIRSHWLRQQAAEEGTFAGVLEDLAERGRPVVVHLRNGRVHRGAPTIVGVDFVALSGPADRGIFVALHAITSVRTLPGEGPTTGDRFWRGNATLAELLSALTGERARVLLVGLDGRDAVSGELRAVGRDVVTVRLDGGGLAYLALDSVAEVSLVESG